MRALRGLVGDDTKHFGRQPVGRNGDGVLDQVGRRGSEAGQHQWFIAQVGGPHSTGRRGLDHLRSRCSFAEQGQHSMKVTQAEPWRQRDQCRPAPLPVEAERGVDRIANQDGRNAPIACSGQGGDARHPSCWVGDFEGRRPRAVNEFLIRLDPPVSRTISPSGSKLGSPDHWPMRACSAVAIGPGDVWRRVLQRRCQDRRRLSGTSIAAARRTRRALVAVAEQRRQVDGQHCESLGRRCTARTASARQVVSATSIVASRTSRVQLELSTRSVTAAEALRAAADWPEQASASSALSRCGTGAAH